MIPIMLSGYFKMTNVKLILLLKFIISTFSRYYGISSGTNLRFWNFWLFTLESGKGLL